jgi:hypothetical protein
MTIEEFDRKEYVAIGHITDVRAYLRAARLIDSAADGDISLSSPIYFLLSHAIELVLKAYILAAGGTEAELRPQKVRHQLDELRNRAGALGYSPSEKLSAVIDMLAPYHANHSFRYRDPGYKNDTLRYAGWTMDVAKGTRPVCSIPFPPEQSPSIALE